MDRACRRQEIPRMVGNGSNVRTLVVDDDPQMLDFLATALREDGYAVRTARTGAGARAEVAERLFDLIVLDLLLPDDDGLLLCNDFSRLGIPVLVCSGTTRHRDGVLA